MKNALMVVDAAVSSINIGDYIQAIAASQFFEKIDLYIERERLNSYQGEPVKMIMNGWYMHQPENWPPTNLICPLFVAFHINSSVKKTMLSDESITYLKRYEPIGCRDIYTMKLLQSKGVRAYFSACLTLTLGLKYRWEGERDGKCYFVDPLVDNSRNVKWLLKNVTYTLFNYKKVNRQARKMYGIVDGLTIRKLLGASSFCCIYGKAFDKKIIEDAIYIFHQSAGFKSEFPTNDDKLHYSESLIKQYSKASLVITSRIHCALPCLGLDTPVIYLNNLRAGKESTCRLGGLMNFFTIMNYTGNALIPLFEVNGKITLFNKPENKDTAKKYIKKLIETCRDFSAM